MWVLAEYHINGGNAYHILWVISAIGLKCINTAMYTETLSTDLVYVYLYLTDYLIGTHCTSNIILCGMYWSWLKRKHLFCE
jgi:hypothetical protein